ncbi:MAG: helix-turn-helix transcriptional regulator [Oscillospiraceae bacterium]|nr:helix-turn-helix transcriptional regulator [Oscillospiraceae bacterium]
MSDIKSIVAKNISELRQKRSMTQLELAEQLNYSDKAVSKWERGDSLPDISVLCDIAALFSVPLDYLVTEEHSKEEVSKYANAPRYSRGIITALAVLLVWFVAVFIFVVISSASSKFTLQWMAFVYAVPVSMIVWLVMNSIWFNRRRNYLIISILTWTVLMSIHLSLLVFSSLNIWMIYLIGIPAQIMILLWSNIKKRA